MADQEKEWDFTVFKDIMFNETSEPEMGTDEERMRICVPFPFEMNVSNNEAAGDFEVHVEGWKNFVYYSPGAASRLAEPHTVLLLHACSSPQG